MTEQFTKWERWMRDIQVETRPGTVHTDQTTGYENRLMDFTYRTDPRAFLGFLGEQIAPCVYRPTAVFAESFLSFGDEVSQADPLTMEIYNVHDIGEGLDDVPTGYSFRVRFRYRDRGDGDSDPREALIDAIGGALGVDTGTVSESRMSAAMEAARRVLVNRPERF